MTDTEIHDHGSEESDDVSLHELRRVYSYQHDENLLAVYEEDEVNEAELVIEQPKEPDFESLHAWSPRLR
jgi:hypothetical protein